MQTSHTIDPRRREFERDASGKPIVDIHTGYRLTARAKDLRHQELRESIASHPPMEILPREYLPSPNDVRRKPLLHFGFPFTEEQLFDCARRNHLIEDQEGSEGIAAIMIKVFSFLRQKTLVWQLWPGWEQPLSLEYEYFLSLFSNRTIAGTVMSGKQERQALRVIRKELDLPPDMKPMWW